MKGLITNVLVIRMVCAGIVAALATKPVAGADDPVVTVDRALGASDGET